MVVERSIGLDSSSLLVGLALRSVCFAAWRVRCVLGFEGAFLRSPSRGGGIVAVSRSIPVETFRLMVVWVESQTWRGVWGVNEMGTLAYRSLSKSHCHYIKQVHTTTP